MSEFNKMTIVELKSYAKENGIDLSGAKTKTKIVSVLLGVNAEINVIGSEKVGANKPAPKSASKTDENGIISTATADNFKGKVFNSKSFPKETKNEDVAVHSEKNMNWQGIGTVSKGYNIVKKEAADMWLTRKGVRKVDPEELATHYGI